MTLRWGPNRPDGTDEARERLIDAAEGCLEKYGVNKTTVADVASAANVSRATVYRYFKDRDELVLAVLAREADEFLLKMKRKFTINGPLDDQLVNGIYFMLDGARSDPKLALLFAPEVLGLTVSIRGGFDLLFERASWALRPVLEHATKSGQLRKGITVDETVEWLLRIVLSLLTVRSDTLQTKPQVSAFVRRFVVPSLMPENSLAPQPKTKS